MNEEDVWNLFEEFKKEDDTGVDNTNIIKCSCGCEDFISEDNMNICSKCSSIVSKVIESTAEWRFYGNDNPKRERQGRDPSADLFSRRRW